MDRITRSAVELLLQEPWPTGLDRKELVAPAAMSKAMEAAADVFARFAEAHQAHAKSGNLTPAGIRAADAEWATPHIAALRDRLADVRRVAEQAETSMLRGMIEPF